MFRDRPPSCPRCGTDLHRDPIGRERWRCPRCGGVMASVADVVDELVAIAPDLRRGRVADVTTWERKHAAVLPCPRCAAAMEPASLGGVDVDRCRTDGIFWFDADELLAVVARAGEQRRARADTSLVDRLLRFLGRSPPDAPVDDDALLAHYLERGGAAWNLSAGAAWIDVRLREWVAAHATRRDGLRVANLGIGVGLWDDWLGYWLSGKGTLTSLDLDPAVAARLQDRQRRECHPYPATAVTGDLLAGALPAAAFDLVTIVGSTAAETGHPARAIASAAALVAPGGGLVTMAPGDPGPLATWLADAGLSCVEVSIDERYSSMRFHLSWATRPA